MAYVVIDTNAVMAIAAFKLDIFEELQQALDAPVQPAVVEGTVLELRQVAAAGKGKDAGAAKLGLALLKTKKIKVIHEEGNVDLLLMLHSRQGDLVLTQDRELKKRLQRPFLTIRQKNRIVKVG